MNATAGFASAYNVEVADHVRSAGGRINIINTMQAQNRYWEPTATAFAGTITSASTAGYYTVSADIVHFDINVAMVDNGTGTGALLLSLPIPAQNSGAALWCCVGQNMSSPAVLFGKIENGGAALAVFKLLDFSYPVASGEVIRLSGSYRRA